MQTEKLFYDHATNEPFTANIIETRSCGADNAIALILDKTIFYPEEGGQPGDRGTINGSTIIDVREKEGEILHIVAACPDSRLKPGPATLVLDAKRRRDFTVQHSAQHLLSGTLFRLTGCNTVSIHLGDEASTIDFNCKDLSSEIMLAAEEAVADAIEEDCPIITHLCPPEDIATFTLRKIPPRREEAIRIVEILGKDATPCCGTHCKSTGQIGMMRILDAEKYKGMTRISFIAGRRVLLHHRMLHENAGLISRNLNVPVNGTGKGTLALMEKANALERRMKEMENAAAVNKARDLLEKAGKQNKTDIIVECYRDESISEVLCIGKAAEKLCESVLILASEKDLKFTAVCHAEGCDIRPLVTGALKNANGKGGGGPSSVQGQFFAKQDLDSFLAELKGATMEGV